MKASAPEIIYLNPRQDALTEMLSTKVKGDIEYIRKDAFIENAVRFLKEWNAYRVCLEGHKDWFIEQFKNYMEGE